VVFEKQAPGLAPTILRGMIIHSVNACDTEAKAQSLQKYAAVKKLQSVVKLS
jgi:hypothetical protein